MTTPDRGIDVLAIGNAVVDVLVHCDDRLLEILGLAKGTMSLVDAEWASEIYAVLGAGVEMSGGSAANTATGVASLGGQAAFIGKVGDDELGGVFRHDLRAMSVTYDVAPSSTGPETARCLVMVTPDAQRTMATYLGVAGELSVGDIDCDLVAQSRIILIEGYLVGLPSAESAINTAVAAAHRQGQLVAVTLSDARWVEAQHRAFTALVDQADILLANEAEACQLTGERGARAAFGVLAGACDVVAVTCSERGAYVTDGSRMIAVPAEPATGVVDTTGAGDLFAAGFLFGIARGRPVADCGRLGALAAAEVISHTGARPQVELAQLAGRAGLLPGPVTVR